MNYGWAIFCLTGNLNVDGPAGEVSNHRLLGLEVDHHRDPVDPQAPRPGIVDVEGPPAQAFDGLQEVGPGRLNPGDCWPVRPGWLLLPCDHPLLGDQALDADGHPNVHGRLPVPAIDLCVDDRVTQRPSLMIS